MSNFEVKTNEVHLVCILWRLAFGLLGLFGPSDESEFGLHLPKVITSQHPSHNFKGDRVAQAQPRMHWVYTHANTSYFNCSPLPNYLAYPVFKARDTHYVFPYIKDEYHMMSRATAIMYILIVILFIASSPQLFMNTLPDYLFTGVLTIIPRHQRESGVACFFNNLNIQRFSYKHWPNRPVSRISGPCKAGGAGDRIHSIFNFPYWVTGIAISKMLLKCIVNVLMILDVTLTSCRWDSSYYSTNGCCNKRVWRNGFSMLE
jgi:hypothetical protein